MALFGDDAADYVTPAGQTVRLPSQLAAQFPGLQPAAGGPPVTAIGAPAGGPGPAAAPPELAGPAMGGPPLGGAPVALPAGGAPRFGPGDAAALAAATPQPTPADAAAAPVTSPGQVPAGAGPQPTVRPSGPVTSPGEAGNAGPDNTPKPLGQQQLTKLDEAGQLANDQRALDETTAAVKQQGTAIADKATAVGDLQTKIADEADRQLQERARIAAANARDLQTRMDAFQAAAKQVTDTRIDHSVNHPVIAAISVALGALGSAMKHEGVNPALTALYTAIDRKVDSQVKDLEQRRAGLAPLQAAVGLQREMGADKLAAQDAYRAGYLDDARRRAEAMAMQLDSPIAKANAQKLIADIDQKRADVTNGYADRIKARQVAEQARKDKLASEAAQRAVEVRGQNLQYQIHTETLAATEREKVAQIAAQALERGDKLTAEKAKKVTELGVNDPSTGDFLLTPEGQAKQAQADQLEAAARRATDPAQAQQINAQAQQLRDSAKINDAAVGTDVKSTEDARKVLKETTNIAYNIDTARRLLNGDPSLFDRKAWADISVFLQGLKINYAQLMGERMSPKALDAIDDITHIDPDSLFSRTADKGKALSAIEAIQTQTTHSANVSLLAAGIKSGWRPPDHPEAVSFSGQTAREATKDEEGGFLTSHQGFLRRPLFAPPAETTGNLSDLPDAGPSEESLARKSHPNPNDERKVPTASNYGIDPDDDVKIRELIKQSGSVGHRAYADIVTTLAQPLTKISGNTARPDLALGVARLLRDEDPRLLSDVLTQLPPLKAQELVQQLKPITAAPAQRGGLTPDAIRELQIKKARLQAGMNAEDPPVVPLTPVGSDVGPGFGPEGPSARAAWLLSHGFVGG